MRKVKLLALLLAALMVVTAFAGCANTKEIESNVADLDERVSALEGKIDDVKDAIEDSNADEELKDIQDALKEQQEANKALLEQIKELTDKVTKVEQDDESADDDAALQAAVKVYTAKLQELKITCELAKDDYVPADYEAVVKALSDAIVAISGAEKAEDVEKLYNDAKAVYDAKATVYTKLINYYNTVRNAITADSKDLIAEIKVFLDGDAVNNIPSAVDTVYPTIGADHKVATYKNGDKNTDGTDVTVNLVSELEKAIAAYNYIVGANFKALVDRAIADIDLIKTVTIDAAGINRVTTAKASYNAVALQVTGNTDNAAYLADSNLALVTNVATLNTAEARLNQLTIAKAMYSSLGRVADGRVQSVFKDYLDLAIKVDYTKKDVYDAINNILAGWISTYALEDENVKIIVNEVEANDNDSTDVDVDYTTYVAKNHETNLCAKAYSDFAAIANRINALNKVTTVAATALDEYGKITKAIEAWKKLQPDDATTTDVDEQIIIDDHNFGLILEAYKINVDLDADGAKVTKATYYRDLYDFAVTEVGTFFSDSYAGIAGEISNINSNISALMKNNTDAAATKYTDIRRYIELEGQYALDEVSTSDTYNLYIKMDVEGTETVSQSKTSLTIAAFAKKYEAYDLTSLLNLADFETAKAAAIERIASFKSGAANVEKLIETITYDLIAKKADSETFTLAAKVKDTAYEGYSLYYYVNLKDADKVDAANAAYLAWINSGANSELAEWVPAVNPETKEVIPNAYTFEKVIDHDALANLKQMSDRIATLKDMAAKIVAHYELIAEVYAQLKSTITLDRDDNLSVEPEEGVTDKKDVLDLYKAAWDAGVDSNKNPLYNVVVLGDDTAHSFSYQGTTYYLAKKNSADRSTDSAVTLQDLLDAGSKAYKAFMIMNANITVKSSGTALNDPSKSTYAAVETAIQSAAELELIMIKDYAMDVVNSSELTTGEKATYCNWLKGATAIQGEANSTIYNYAQQIYAFSGLDDIASYERGETVNVMYAKNATETSNKTLNFNVFTAPDYGNIG